jgi:hypothetical protein
MVISLLIKIKIIAIIRNKNMQKIMIAIEKGSILDIENKDQIQSREVKKEVKDILLNMSIIRAEEE